MYVLLVSGWGCNDSGVDVVQRALQEENPSGDLLQEFDESGILGVGRHIIAAAESIAASIAFKA